MITELSEHVMRIYITPTLDKSSFYSSSEYDYQFEFSKAGTFGIIKKWIKSGYKEPEKDIAALLEKMLRRCLPL